MLYTISSQYHAGSPRKGLSPLPSYTAFLAGKCLAQPCYLSNMKCFWVDFLAFGGRGASAEFKSLVATQRSANVSRHEPARADTMRSVFNHPDIDF